MPVRTPGWAPTRTARTHSFPLSTSNVPALHDPRVRSGQGGPSLGDAPHAIHYLERGRPVSQVWTRLHGFWRDAAAPNASLGIMNDPFRRTAVVRCHAGA